MEKKRSKDSEPGKELSNGVQKPPIVLPAGLKNDELPNLSQMDNPKLYEILTALQKITSENHPTKRIKPAWEHSRHIYNQLNERHKDKHVTKSNAHGILDNFTDEEDTFYKLLPLEDDEEVLTELKNYGGMFQENTSDWKDLVYEFHHRQKKTIAGIADAIKKDDKALKKVEKELVEVRKQEQLLLAQQASYLASIKRRSEASDRHATKMKTDEEYSKDIRSRLEEKIETIISEIDQTNSDLKKREEKFIKEKEGVNDETFKKLLDQYNSDKAELEKKLNSQKSRREKLNEKLDSLNSFLDPARWNGDGSLRRQYGFI